MPRSASFVEKCVRKRVVHKGRAISFCVDTVRLPNGRKALREYVDHPGAVCVVPFKDPNTVVLVRQYRYPIGKTTYEIPAGKLSPGEAPLPCVHRELQEETGFRAKTVRRILTFWPAPAFSNEGMHVYRAEGLTAGKMSPDEDEFIAPVEVPFKKALGWIGSGRIKDAKTVIGLLACAQRTPSRNKAKSRRLRPGRL